MPVKLSWYSDKEHIGLMVISDPWEWDELIAVRSDWCDIGVLREKPCYLIADYSSSEIVPSGALREIPKLVKVNCPFENAVIVVGLTTVQHQFLFRTFASLFGDTDLADTVSAAAEAIRTRNIT